MQGARAALIDWTGDSASKHRASKPIPYY